ncbi:hypothetical protein [Vibrio owensii]|uniref:hypothetical protein n=1 Tax=Vibrio harveyi group TaxID=717610 RepID=UPI003CC64562
MSATTQAIAFLKALNILSKCRFESEEFFSIHRNQEYLFKRFLNNRLSGDQICLDALNQIEDKAKELLPPEKFELNHYHVSSCIQDLIDSALKGQHAAFASKVKSNTNHIGFDIVLALTNLIDEGFTRSPAKATMHFARVLSKLEDRFAPVGSHNMESLHNDLYTLINHTDGFKELEVIQFNELLRSTFESKLWIKRQ